MAHGGRLGGRVFQTDRAVLAAVSGNLDREETEAKAEMLTFVVAAGWCRRRASRDAAGLCKY